MARYVCMYVAPVLRYYYKYTGFRSQIFGCFHYWTAQCD